MAFNFGGTFPMPGPLPNIPGGSSSGSEMVPAGEFNFSPPGGQNQFMNFPTMGGPGGQTATGSDLNPLLFGNPTYSRTMTNPSGEGAFPLPGGAQAGTPPGIVPPSGGNPPLGPFSNPADTGKAGVGARLPGGAYTGRTLDPQLTEQLAQWLMSQLGKGATPFDLSAILPSTGQATAPGTLTAPENPILQSLQQFYQTGTGGPLPGVLPMWQSEIQAMNIPIQQQLANIKEQFGARGALGSSELGSALETYGAQTAADQEALLGQLTLQALPGMEQFGVGLQAEDQASIDRLLQEFQRTQPEYSPLLQEEFGFGTAFPPIYGRPGFGASFQSALGGALGQTLGTFGLSAGPGHVSGSFGTGG